MYARYALPSAHRHFWEAILGKPRLESHTCLDSHTWEADAGRRAAVMRPA